MPHLILEHDAALAETHDLPAMVDALFEAACAHPLFAKAPHDVKVRTVAFENGRSGLAAPGHAHLTIRLLTGRTSDQKQGVAQDMLAVLTRHLPDIGSLSVEPVEMDRDTYVKRAL